MEAQPPRAQGTPRGADPAVDRAPSFFARLDVDSLRWVARALAVPGEGAGKKALVARIEAGLADRGRLVSLVEALPSEGRAVLEILCEAGVALEKEYLAEELEAALGKAAAARGLSTLAGAGLVIMVAPRLGTPAVGIPPPLVPALLPLFDAWRRGEDDPAAPVEGTPFGAAVLLAYLDVVRPRVTAGTGDLYSVDLRKLCARFQAVDAERLNAWFSILESLSLWGPASDGRVSVRAERALALFDEPGEAVAARWLARRLRELPAGSEGALELLARRPGWSDRAEAERAVRFAVARGGRADSWAPRLRLAHTKRTGELRIRDLQRAGLVEADLDGSRLRFGPELRALLVARAGATPAQLPGPRAACHVQPNFEVIVPPEAGARAAFAVGRFCELVRFDAVATLSITATSVRAAAGRGMTPEQMIAALGAACAHGVPANVERGVRDFAAEVRPVHVLAGAVVHVPGGQPPGVEGLAPSGLPGLFLIEPYARDQVVRDLRKAGFAVDVRDWEGRRAEPRSGRREERLDWDEEDSSDPIDEDDLLLGPSEAGGISLERLVEILRRARSTPAPPPLAPPAGGRALRDPSARGSPDQALLPPRPISGKPAPPAARAHEGAARPRASLPRPAQKPEPAPESAEAVLLRAALLHAPPAWREHLAALAGLPRGALEDPQALWLREPRARAAVLDAAREGLPCCGERPLFGEPAARAAVAEGKDLLVLPAGAAQPVRLTPHQLGRRGAEPFVAGHLAGGGEDRAYGLAAALVAEGPPSSQADRERARGWTAPPAVSERIGRNEPCPCGSGRKYKKCCLYAAATLADRAIPRAEEG